MNSLNELVYLCKLVGSHFDLSQAGGGNISIKEGNNLYIKASGLILSEVETDYGITPLSLKDGHDFTSNLLNIDEGSYGKELERIIPKGYLRPSMESPLHLLLKKKYIIHCHPTSVLALCSSLEGKSQLSSNFPKAQWIPYCSPGLKLAQFFKQSVDLDKNIYFMQNHGLIIAHDSIEEAIHLLKQTATKCHQICNKPFNPDIFRILEFIHKKLSISTSLLQSNDHTVKTNDLSDYAPICPDDVVYLGHRILSISDDLQREIKEFHEHNSVLPKVIRHKQTTYIFSSNLKKCRLIEEQLRANIIARSSYHCDLTIEKNEVDFLSNWEAEKYRAKGK